MIHFIIYMKESKKKFGAVFPPNWRTFPLFARLKIANNKLSNCFSCCLFESRLASGQSNPNNVPFNGLEQVCQIKRVHQSLRFWIDCFALIHKCIPIIEPLSSRCSNSKKGTIIQSVPFEKFIIYFNVHCTIFSDTLFKLCSYICCMSSWHL